MEHIKILSIKRGLSINTVLLSCMSWRWAEERSYGETYYIVSWTDFALLERNNIPLSVLLSKES